MGAFVIASVGKIVGDRVVGALLLTMVIGIGEGSLVGKNEGYSVGLLVVGTIVGKTVG